MPRETSGLPFMHFANSHITEACFISLNVTGKPKDIVLVPHLPGPIRAIFLLLEFHD
jgi:hypothetical protein